ncbi:MAG: hypothetical protein ACLTMP_02025 [Eggerthella lenta]
MAASTNEGAITGMELGSHRKASATMTASVRTTKAADAMPKSNPAMRTVVVSDVSTVRSRDDRATLNEANPSAQHAEQRRFREGEHPSADPSPRYVAESALIVR